jgi:GT2 family glycosyltransferase
VADRHALAVVIPTRDRARRLERLLRSLEAATMPSGGVEVVVVNDGSRDDTAEVVRRSSLPIRCLNEDGTGPARARNTGWRATDADLVLFLDDDCVVSEDALVKLVAALDGNGAVGADIRPLTKGGISARLTHLEGLSRHGLDDGRVRYLAMAAALFRRHELEDTGGFDESFGRAAGEDVDLCYRLVRRGVPLAVAPGSIVWHEDRSGLVALWRTYYRHGTAQRRLRARHPQRGPELRLSARRRSSLGHWRSVYTRYRREESVPVSAACLGLRAVMMVPWIAGATVGDRRRRPSPAKDRSSYSWSS